MKKSSIQTICCASLATVALSFSGCGKKVVEESGPQVRPAKLVTVDAAHAERTLTFPAVIEARSSAVLTFPVGGDLEQILVRAGDDVAEGAIIARLNSRTFDNRLASAQTQFDEASSEFARAERLLKEDAIAKSVYDQRKTALDVATAALDDARKSLEDSVLTSPFDGVVAERHIEENQNVAAGAPIVTVQTTGGADAVINVPSTLVANSQFIEPIETVVMLDTRPELRIPAKLEEKAALADATTQTFEVRFTFASPEGLTVLPGMTGTLESRITINSEEYANQITVPISAVVSDGDSEYVWVVDSETMVASRQDVTTDRRVSDTVIITEGLSEGDVVVGAGASYLHEGMKVLPYEPK